MAVKGLIINKVFVKRKILSIETILSAHTRAQTHTHTHTRTRTRTRTHAEREREAPGHTGILTIQS